MAGPIQTAIGQALGAVAAVSAVGKNLNENEKQTAKKQTAEAAKAKEAEAKAGQSKAISEIAETLKSMQQKGFASPLEVIFNQGGEPLATSSEAASVVATQSLNNIMESKKRSKSLHDQRRKYLIERGQLVSRKEK